MGSSEPIGVQVIGATWWSAAVQTDTLHQTEK